MSLSSRRTFLQLATVGGLMMMQGGTARASQTGGSVPFRFRSGGDPVIGALHLPAGQPKAAVVLCGAWTAVKEQAAGLYARALAERGYAALAFDHRYFGESGGNPRQLESPQAKVEDVRSAVTALLAHQATRGLPVMGVGLCAGGGYMAKAVAQDDRIRAFAGVAGAYSDAAELRARMPDLDRLIARGVAARERFERTGTSETIPAVGLSGGDVAMPFAEAHDYYGRRAAHSNYVNGFAVQSYAEVLSWDAIGYAPAIRVPVLVVHSNQAAMPHLARRFLAEVRGRKSELWLTSTNHVDFYDNPKLIAAAANAIAAHFSASWP
ncbi:alpha/beta hydrolase [Sphingomonas sp. MS122]|uniref:alpha/beta hydrolase n=1 Tax=Sphingomonas sp. MS122 TaxID=3412683 RepID=UPI003C2B2EB0